MRSGEALLRCSIALASSGRCAGLAGARQAAAPRFKRRSPPLWRLGSRALPGVHREPCIQGSARAGGGVGLRPDGGRGLCVHLQGLQPCNLT